MAEIAQRYQKELPRLKKMVESSYEYFKPNYESYHRDRKFIFDTSLSDEELDLLKELLKPQIEANTLEAFLSRLLGEFAKQEPSLIVSALPGAVIDPQTIEIVEGHMRALLFDANNDGFEYETYKDSLSGGFSVMKNWTEYQSDDGDGAFDQCIKIGRPKDVTLCGFDPLATLPHKGDGRYYFELYPKTKDEFLSENPGVDIKEIDFTRTLGSFNWSYTNNTDEILLVCDFYEKKKKPIKIYKLSDGRVLNKDDYEQEQKIWAEAIQKGFVLQQPPTIVKERKSEKVTICRYRFIENQVLEYVETDYDSLPGVFVDGNSVMLRDNGTGPLRQKTRSYIHHAKDIQRMKNMSFQTLANELENMVQHKWIMPVEAIPEQYQDAYTNNQLPTVVLYNQFKDNNPQLPLNPPREVQRTPIPPEVTNTITLTDQLNQMVLGSFDSALGINNNQLSGKAIIAGATQSNAAAMPYIVGFLNGLNKLAQNILELIPKYYKTPRTIPIVDKEGKRSYVKINVPGAPNLNYGKNVLQVKVEAGVNFSVQKQQALQYLQGLMQSSPQIAAFIAQDGLDVVFDNMEFRGADILKSRAPAFMQQIKMQQAQAAQNNPMAVRMQLEQQKLGMEQMHNQNQLIIDTAKVQNDKEANDNDRLKIMLEAAQANRKDVVELAKAHAEDKRSAVELGLKVHDQALKHADQLHRHAKDTIELGHQVNQSQQPTIGENENGEEVDSKSN